MGKNPFAQRKREDINSVRRKEYDVPELQTNVEEAAPKQISNEEKQKELTRNEQIFEDASQKIDAGLALEGAAAKQVGDAGYKIGIALGTSGSAIALKFGIASTAVWPPILAGVGAAIVIAALVKNQIGIIMRLSGLLEIQMKDFVQMMRAFESMKRITDAIPAIANKLKIDKMELAIKKWRDFVSSFCSPSQRELIQKQLKLSKERAAIVTKQTTRTGTNNPTSWQSFKKSISGFGRRIKNSFSAVGNKSSDWWRAVGRYTRANLIIQQITYMFQNILTSFTIFVAEFNIIMALYSNNLSQKTKDELKQTNEIDKLLRTKQAQLVGGVIEGNEEVTKEEVTEEDVQEAKKDVQEAIATVTGEEQVINTTPEELAKNTANEIQAAIGPLDPNIAAFALELVGETLRNDNGLVEVLENRVHQQQVRHGGRRRFRTRKLKKRGRRTKTY